MQPQTNNGKDHRKMERTKTPGVYRRGGRYAYTFTDANGKPRKLSARTYEEARRKKAEKQADVARGEYDEKSRLTFDVYFREWVDRYQGRGRRGFREATRIEYRRLAEKYALPYFGSRLRLSDLTPRRLSGFIGWLCDENEQGRRLSDSTVSNIFDPVRSCLATAVQEGLIRQNPSQSVSLPHRPRPDDDDESDDRRVLTREQLAAFLDVVHPGFRLFFELLAATGVRVSEAVALQWRHLSLDGSLPFLRVRRGYSKGRLEAPKTKYGRRDVPLHPDLVVKLRQHRAASEWGDKDDLVFPSRVGTFLDADNLRRRILRPVAEEIGTPWAGFHTFRHTCASMLFARGRNAVEVQKWIGHHKASFTLDTYIHLLNDEQAEPLDLRFELGGGNGVATERTGHSGNEQPGIPDVSTWLSGIPELTESDRNAG
jgi:integrase